ncbi:hypothetical protein BD626DRAFT_472593 [Schizophyllum amplum]|uniref:Uncharacterized protein n=1 Tax=Schizophyllum amplum TaxID=97359 RepID=A0A550CW36_9AGAR|nr:hypothetical protein BD626DRAFT_472593 [Auriculariopsis ampla]
MLPRRRQPPTIRSEWPSCWANVAHITPGPAKLPSLAGTTRMQVCHPTSTSLLHLSVYG